MKEKVIGVMKISVYPRRKREDKPLKTKLGSLMFKAYRDKFNKTSNTSVV